MKNKKADISVSMIIGIVIVVITFAIIALVYYQLTTSVNLDRETCKTSAMFRGSMPSEKFGSFAGAQDLISLKCKTRKICVTTNKIVRGECEKDFGNLEGKYSTYRISKDPIKADQQIKTLLAREMADCWDMLGRGNFAIFKIEMTTQTSIGAVAVVCSRIQFDKTIIGTGDGQLGIQEIKGFNRYLLTHKVPNYEISYWDFLRNAYDGETMTLLSGQMVKGNSNSGKVSSFLDETLKIDDAKTIVFMEVRPTLAGALIGGGIGGTIGAISGGGLAGAKGLLRGAAGGAYLGLEVGDWIQTKDLNENGLFQDGTSAAGIFLTTYDMKGFQDILPKLKPQQEWYEHFKFWKRNIKASFEIASYA